METILTNQRSSVDRKTVQKVGNDALVEQITDASHTGCTVTAKMIAGMVAMNCQKIVRNVMKKVISNVTINVVSRNDGYVISKTIAATTLTKKMKCARTNTENVRSLSLDVRTRSVSPVDGAVITITTVQMNLTNKIVEIMNVNQVISSVLQGTVLRITLGVTEIGIAEILVMNLIARHVSLMVDIVHLKNSNVITIFALKCETYVMVAMIALTIQMNVNNYVAITHVIHYVDSSVTIINVPPSTKNVMEWITVEMAQMKTT